MNNISLIMYTNEKYLPIAYLSSLQFKKYFQLNIPKYIATNKFDNKLQFDYGDFQIIDTNTPFMNDASHFRRIMIDCLRNHINTDYILYFQDDYFLIKNFKTDIFIELFKYIQHRNIGFMSLHAHHPDSGAVVTDIEPNIIKFNYNYIYAFSTQPCVWNKRFLLDILEANDSLSLTMLDTANFKCNKGLHISNCWDYNWDSFGLLFDSPLMGSYAFDTHNGIDDYYLLLYSEIIRHGKFNTHTHINNKIVVENIIRSHDLQNDSRYSLFL